MSDQPETIFRVQNKYGKGPYMDDFALDRILSHHFGLHYPSLGQDLGIERDTDPEEHCGFLTLESLHNWFSDIELEELDSLGYVIMEVEGFITAVGEKQVLFIPADRKKSA